MAKAVLIMEMPLVCGCCKMYRGNYYTGGDCTCRVTGDKVELNTKAETCPLRELPEENHNNNECDEYLDGYDAGWNACLKEIAGNT